MAEEIRGERVVLRPLVAADRPRMRAMLAEPAVAARWLGTRGLDETVAEVFALEAGDAMFAIEVDGEVVGMIQHGEEADPDYRHASIDIFVATAWQGQGLGTDAVRTLAQYLIRNRGHHRVTIDPAADNQRAIRAYARAGFRPVGLMRAYERGPDGTWHDGLLMDLLADDLG